MIRTRTSTLKLQNFKYNEVWPRNDNETDDRMMKQIRFMETYRPRILDQDQTNNGSTNASVKMKIILRVGNFNFKQYKSGMSVSCDF